LDENNEFGFEDESEGGGNNINKRLEENENRFDNAESIADRGSSFQKFN